jgi:hydrogenase/urease accessory protein HupE
MKFVNNFLSYCRIILRNLIPVLFVFFILIIFSSSADAHTLPFDFKQMSKGGIGWVYLKMGYTHIIPFGIDHILFVLGIFLLKPNLKTVIWQATAFTIAHSITLGLAVYGLIRPQSSIIEPVIALSIVFIGVENIITKDLKWWRLIVIFMFGLIHGCGFAGALADAGLPENDFVLALISFNGGVELGQITVILTAFFLFGKWFADKSWYRSRITIPVSLCISLIAVYWTIERAFL